MEIEIKGAPIEALSFEEEFKGSKTACCDCGATVGTFTWVGDDRYKCQSCRMAPRMHTAPVFPLVLDHAVTGQKIKVDNIYQLRRVEAQHGISNVAFNQNSSNWER